MKLVKVSTIKKNDASEYDKFDNIVRQVIPRIQKQIETAIKQLEKIDPDKFEDEGEDYGEVEEMISNWETAKDAMEGII